MAQMKGNIVGLILFIGLIMPMLLMIGIDSIHQNAFMKMTAEVGEIVKGEGGVTSEVNRVVNNLEERGYTISFTDKQGNAVTSKRFFGDEIVIHYNYKYINVRGEKELNTTNDVFIMRR